MLSVMADTPTQEIANRVRGVAAENDLTQSDVASIIGVVDRKSVGARYSARVPFTGAELFRLSLATGVDVRRFFPESVAS